MRHAAQNHLPVYVVVGVFAALYCKSSLTFCSSGTPRRIDECDGILVEGARWVSAWTTGIRMRPRSPRSPPDMDVTLPHSSATPSLESFDDALVIWLPVDFRCCQPLSTPLCSSSFPVCLPMRPSCGINAGAVVPVAPALLFPPSHLPALSSSPQRYLCDIPLRPPPTPCDSVITENSSPSRALL